MNWVVCKASEQDKEIWAPMRHALWPDFSIQEHMADLKNWLSQEDFRGWLALDGGEPVGFAEAFLRPFANGCDSRPVVFLEGIWVKEAYRHKGVGKKLLEAVEHWAKQQGIHEIGSDSYIDDTNSHQAHRRWGFEEREKVIYFRKKI